MKLSFLELSKIFVYCMYSFRKVVAVFGVFYSLAKSLYIACVVFVKWLPISMLLLTARRQRLQLIFVTRHFLGLSCSTSHGHVSRLYVCQISDESTETITFYSSLNDELRWLWNCQSIISHHGSHRVVKSLLLGCCGVDVRCLVFVQCN